MFIMFTNLEKSETLFNSVLFFYTFNQNDQKKPMAPIKGALH